MSNYLCLVLLFSHLGSLAQGFFNQAEKQFEAGNYKDAKILFQKHLEFEPNHLKTREYLGDIEAHLGNWDTAIPIYSALSNNFPDNAEYHYKYGGAMGMKASDNRWYALMNYSRIRQEFEEAIRLNPNHIDAHWALVEYNLQLPFILGGGEEKARFFAKQLSKISKVDGYLALGKIAEFYHHYSEAEKAYVKANNIGQSVHTFRTLVKYYKRQNQNKKADAVSKEAERKFGSGFAEGNNI